MKMTKRCPARHFDYADPTDRVSSPPDQVRLRGEVHRLVAPRDQKYQSNFVEVSPAPLRNDEKSDTHSRQFRNDKIVYRRYAGLFFCLCVDSSDNELAYLEAIHLFVEVLGTQL